MSESHDLERKLSDLYSENDDRFHILVEAARLDPRRDFKNRDLRGVIFDNADLTRFDFANSDLRGTRLRFSYALPMFKLENVRVDDEDATWIATRAAIQSAEDKKMLEELRIALKSGGFEVLYQPIFDVKRRRVVRAEAVVGWHSKTFGQVPPEKFTSMLAAQGLINDLAKIIVERVTSDQWLLRDNAVACQISIELDTSTFSNLDFMSRLRQQIQASGADIRFLVDEGCLIGPDIGVEEVFTHLSDSGIRVGVKHHGWNLIIDEFRKLQISELMIDRSLIQEAAHEGKYREVLGSLARLRDVLRVELSAQWVEAEDQLSGLEDIGVVTAQGPVFDRSLLDIHGFGDLRLWEKQFDDSKGG